MDTAEEKLEAQIRLWSMKIEHLAAKAQKAGARARFDDLMYVDELKALYAIANLKFDKFRTAGAKERARLTAEMKTAWDDLDAAFKNPKP